MTVVIDPVGFTKGVLIAGAVLCVICAALFVWQNTVGFGDDK